MLMEIIIESCFEPESRVAYQSRVDFLVLNSLTAADTTARTVFRANLAALGRELQERGGTIGTQATFAKSPSSLNVEDVVGEASLAGVELTSIGRRYQETPLVPILALLAIFTLSSLRTVPTLEDFGKTVVALSDVLGQLDLYIQAMPAIGGVRLPDYL